MLNYVTQKIILPFLVVGIGSILIFGHILDNNLMRTIGYSTASSPLPIPFTDSNNLQESFGHTYLAYVITDTGATIRISLEDFPLSGPHKRQIPYISAIVFSPSKTTLGENILQYGFCSAKRPLLKDVLGDITPVKITVKIASNTPNNSWQRSTTILCGN